MCGICGIVDFSGRPVSEVALAPMTARLRHRGPEARGFFASPAPGARAGARPAVGLGHTRLKIIDLSDGANQPLCNEDGSVWVIFNGEIYNYVELRSELKASGHQFRTESDTETVLHLYEEAGDALVERLEGMFAFALWDERRRRLLLARDRAGKKPLFYSRQGALFFFFSLLNSL